jgi:hypothetical protein
MARPEEQLAVELQLRRGVSRSYRDGTFESVEFVSITILSARTFENCVFNRCTFHQCRIGIGAFVNCGFIACDFLDCAVEEDDAEGRTNWFRGCVVHGVDVEASLSLPQEPEADPARVNADAELETKVLEQFWPPGRPRAQKHRAVRTLLLGFDKGRYRDVNRAIGALRRDGFIAISGDMSELNFEMIADIRRRLGRS